jgi:hypothetical protein
MRTPSAYRMIWRKAEPFCDKEGELDGQSSLKGTAREAALKPIRIPSLSLATLQARSASVALGPWRCGGARLLASGKVPVLRFGHFQCLLRDGEAAATSRS